MLCQKDSGKVLNLPSLSAHDDPFLISLYGLYELLGEVMFISHVAGWFIRMHEKGLILRGRLL